MRERRRLTIYGHVQGVYFRETVRQIAVRYVVAGFVRNAGRERVEIEAEGEADVLDAFINEVLASPPRSARIDRVHAAVMSPVGEAGFSVAPTTLS